MIESEKQLFADGFNVIQPPKNITYSKINNHSLIALTPWSKEQRKIRMVSRLHRHEEKWAENYTYGDTYPIKKCLNGNLLSYEL